MTTAVTAVPPAASDRALAHFEAALAFETDCWDVHDSLSNGKRTSCCLTCAATRFMTRGMCPAR